MRLRVGILRPPSLPSKTRFRAFAAHARSVLWVLCVVGGTLAAAPERAEARLETLRWTHPNPSLVDGFRVFVRYEGQGYTTPSYDGMPVPNGGVYQVDFDVDDALTVHFVATAYNQSEESALSNEITRFPPFCGDGALDPGETCDDGNTAGGDGCRADCTLESCGDGILDPSETCDDGNLTNGDGCDATCQVEEPICGNGIADPGELCDDGNTIGGDGCSAICTLELCGDAVLDPAEECDDGNTIDGDGCDASCRIEMAPFCGDGNADPGELCDDGNTINGDGCSAICTLELCGDAVLDPAEECDDGNTVGGDGCRANCTLEICGDAVLDPGEECDDGNNQNGDGCDAACSIEDPPACGDGFLDPGEQCDDGNIQNGDGCDATCAIEVPPVCGDGFLDLGEQCDDGNIQNGDGCDATCMIEAPPVCGDGFLDPGEQCDDGDVNNGDGCSDACVVEPLPPPTLLLNPNFDDAMQLSGWSPIQGRVEWAALDIDGLAWSGSTRIRNRSETAGDPAGIYSDCIPVVAGENYTFGSWGYNPGPSQAATLSATVVWFADSACQDEVEERTVVTELAEETWALAEGSADAPAGARSAVVEVYNAKGQYNDSTLFTYVDSVSFVPEPGQAQGALVALIALALCMPRTRRPTGGESNR